MFSKGLHQAQLAVFCGWESSEILITVATIVNFLVGWGIRAFRVVGLGWQDEPLHALCPLEAGQ